MKDTTRTALSSGMDTEKLPCPSVSALADVPLTVTLAPARPLPLAASVILPLTILSNDFSRIDFSEASVALKSVVEPNINPKSIAHAANFGHVPDGLEMLIVC
jgi:hypothetical protein